MTGWKEDTYLGYVMGKYAKNVGFIAPGVIMNTQKFINAIGFTEIIQIWWLTSLNIIIEQTLVQLIGVF